MHSIIEHADLHFSYHYITKPGDSLILKKAANFTPVSPNRRDRRTPVKLSRSNEATSQVTKGYSAHASLTNEVLPVRFRHTLKKKAANFPRSNEATSRVTKGQPMHLASVGLTNEVLQLLPRARNRVVNCNIHQVIVYRLQQRIRAQKETVFTYDFVLCKI